MFNNKSLTSFKPSYFGRAVRLPHSRSSYLLGANFRSPLLPHSGTSYLGTNFRPPLLPHSIPSYLDSNVRPPLLIQSTQTITSAPSSLGSAIRRPLGAVQEPVISGNPFSNETTALLSIGIAPESHMVAAGKSFFSISTMAKLFPFLLLSYRFSRSGYFSQAVNSATRTIFKYFGPKHLDLSDDEVCQSALSEVHQAYSLSVPVSHVSSTDPALNNAIEVGMNYYPKIVEMLCALHTKQSEPATYYAALLNLPYSVQEHCSIQATVVDKKTNHNPREILLASFNNFPGGLATELGKDHYLLASRSSMFTGKKVGDQIKFKFDQEFTYKHQGKVYRGWVIHARTVDDQHSLNGSLLHTAIEIEGKIIIVRLGIGKAPTINGAKTIGVIDSINNYAGPSTWSAATMMAFNKLGYSSGDLAISDADRINSHWYLGQIVNAGGAMSRNLIKPMIGNTRSIEDTVSTKYNDLHAELKRIFDGNNK